MPQVGSTKLYFHIHFYFIVYYSSKLNCCSLNSYIKIGLISDVYLNIKGF